MVYNPITYLWFEVERWNFILKVKKLLNGYFANKYGSLRGFLLAQKYSFYYQLGFYSKYQNINWENVKRLVFVCKGNICRSAYAEAFTKSLAIPAASFGIKTVDGSSADTTAVCYAEKKGLDLSGHMTTSIGSFRRQAGDIYIAMEPLQLTFLEHFGYNTCDITLAGLWCKNPVPYIEDPYGRPPEYLDTCFNYIEKAVNTIKDNLSTK